MQGSVVFFTSWMCWKVRISMACDAIMAELVEKRQATLAYLASPAVDCLLPRGCTEAIECCILIL